MVEPVSDNILNLVNELYNNLDAKDKIINEQALEIAHLNLQLDQALKDYEELLIKIDKAMDYIVKNCILSDEWTELDFCNFVPTGKITYKQLTSKKVKNLLDILVGKE